MATRKQFIEDQTDLMIRKARSQGGGLVDLSKEENIDIMIQVLGQVELNLKATKGYKYTGTMVALDGSADDMIAREAKIFWEERGMRKKIDSALAEIKASYDAGLLRWNYETVQGLITPYPKRGQLDTLKVGQEDEAAPDPDQVITLGSCKGDRRGGNRRWRRGG